MATLIIIALVLVVVISAFPNNSNDGRKHCPKCGSDMKPMASGKGWSCAKPGNRWTGRNWTLCDGVIWNKGGGFKKPTPIERANNFPMIAKPTAEQVHIKDHLSTAPETRGGRCTIVDAGPGTAKTTTLSWALSAIYNRLGNLFGYGIRAFNKNAANVLITKLPSTVPDISTLHSAGNQAQGNKGMMTKNKVSKAFRGLVDHLEPKDRPSIGRLQTVLERARNLCLWTTADDKIGWNDIISTVLERFPSLAKRIANQEEHLREYLPALANITLADGKTFDFSDMITRPVMLAIQKSGWRMNTSLVLKSAEQWEDADVAHFAKLIKQISMPIMRGLVIDEAQDLDLAQIAIILAQTWKTGELTLIGDDRKGNFGEVGFKAGQAIYGWRGAFSGSLVLIARLWHELTGETATTLSLSETFRHGPEICQAYHPLNTVIRSNLPKGKSQAYAVNAPQAFTKWLDLPTNETALWITRTNAAITPIFLETLKSHADCTIRGGPDFASSIDAALYDAAGCPDDNGEFRIDLATAMVNLKKALCEMGSEGEVDPNSLEKFVLGIGEAIQADPSLLTKANLPTNPTVGNLRRFILNFADKASRRVLTTVYRCKGDEADTTIVDDVDKFNESWGNPHEDLACRHVALSRAKQLLLTIGVVSGSDMPKSE